MKEFFYSSFAQKLIIFVILLNGILIGLQTFPAIEHSFGEWMKIVDYSILAIFSVEVLLRLYYERFAFFRSAWNWFDFIIVLIGYMPDSGVFTVLRIFRVFRLFRLFSVVPQLRVIIDAMVHSIPSLGWVIVFAITINYIFAIIGIHLYGQDFPKYFGDLPRSMYTMFEMMTRAGWNTLTRTVAVKHASFFLFIIPYILIASYVILNLIMGVLINSMRTAQTASAEKAQKDQKAAGKEKLGVILAEIALIKEKVRLLEEGNHNKGIG